jgi:hypothetical protein
MKKLITVIGMVFWLTGCFGGSTGGMHQLRTNPSVTKGPNEIEFEGATGCEYDHNCGFGQCCGQGGVCSYAACVPTRNKPSSDPPTTPEPESTPAPSAPPEPTPPDPPSTTPNGAPEALLQCK